MRFIHKLDKLMIPAVVTACALFLGYAVGAVITNHPEEKRVITYSPQVIQKVDPVTGDVSVPRIEGYDLPAVHLGETVPVQAIVTNTEKVSVNVTGSTQWLQVPPGLYVVISANVGRVIQPGISALAFNNVIPPEVTEYVKIHGPTKFTIHGNVKVDWPNSVDATWETPIFWVVP